MKRQIGIVIQARMGSTRLPEKVLTPILEQNTILDILMQKLSALPFKVVVATSFNKKDDVLENWARKNNHNIYRGSEDDVLQRFIDCADFYNFDFVVRVCADNPFLDIILLKSLIEKVDKQDYLSFSTDDGTPVIKTHFGVFCEIVSLRALKQVNENASATAADKQHVTSFVYTNDDLFNVQLLELPTFFTLFPQVRLTIDTQIDFDSCQQLLLKGIDFMNISSQELFEIVSQSPKLSRAMKTQIKINSK